jgi:hypothetical protein
MSVHNAALHPRVRTVDRSRAAPNCDNSIQGNVPQLDHLATATQVSGVRDSDRNSDVIQAINSHALSYCELHG